MRRLHLTLLAIAALPLLLIAAAPAAAEGSTPFILGQGTRARALTFGADGNLWFTANKYAYQGFTNVLGRATTAGEVREFSLPERNRMAIGGITAGPDGNIWFADTARDAIGRSDLAGQVSEFPLAPGSAPVGIATGPDGAIWFAETGLDRLGRIDAGGSVTTFALPAGSRPLQVAAADGALWVTENGRSSIARVSPDGAFTEYPLPHPDSKPKDIVRGADGTLWFSEEGGSRLGRIDPAGAVSEIGVPGNLRGTDSLAAGPDGTIFFVTGTDRAWVEIGSLSPAGDLTGLGCVTVQCDLPVTALAVGPEGDLWYGTGVRYTEGGGGTAQLELGANGTIGRYQPPEPVAVSIPQQVLKVHGHYVRVLLACDTAGGEGCRGTLFLEGKIRRPGARRGAKASYGSRSFRLRTGTTHRFALKINRFAGAILRRHPLRVTARVVLHGGPQASRQLTLRSMRRR